MWKGPVLDRLGSDVRGSGVTGEGDLVGARASAAAGRTRPSSKARPLTLVSFVSLLVESRVKLALGPG